MKKQLLYLLLTGAAFLGGMAPSGASDILGSEIIYRCQGNGVYLVTVRVYRDCNGTQTGQSDLIASSGNQTVTVSNQTKVSVRDVTGIESGCSLQSRCNSGTFQYGIEEHVWSMTLDLSSYSNCEWILSWEQCCRSAAITTGMAGQTLYNTAMLNKCVSPCNSSPDFINTPPMVLCHNNDALIDHGVRDTIDGTDSFSYELVNALQGPNQSASYSGSFTGIRPLTFFGFPNSNLSPPAGIDFRSHTGVLRFRPTQTNQFAVIVILVKEWREINGQMQVIGWIRREVPVIIISCQNTPPKIQPPYQVHACPGQQVCLDIITSDDDSDDTVRISWNNGIPGATFTHNSGAVKHAEGQVCWTPLKEHISNVPYTFAVTATDNFCPMPGTSVRYFSVFVMGTKADLHTEAISCTEVALNHTQYNPTQDEQFSYWIVDTTHQPVWNSNKKQDTAALKEGIYIAKLLVNDRGCWVEYSETVEVSGTGSVHLSKYREACEEELVNIQTSRSGNRVYDWYEIDSSGTMSWIDNGSSLSLKPVRSVTFLASSPGNCSITDTTHFTLHPKPVVQFEIDPDSACLKDAIFQFTDQSSISSGYIAERIWDFRNGGGDTGVSVYTTYIYPDTHSVLLEVISDKGCSRKKSGKLLVLPGPQLQQVADQVQLDKGDTGIFDVGNAHPNAVYQWQVDQGSGFGNLSDGGPFSGVHTRELRFVNVDSSHSGYLFRCVVRVGNCSDTSNIASLTVKNPLSNTRISGMPGFRIYPNPAGTFLYLETPQGTAAQTYRIFDAYGRELMRGVIQDGISVADVSKLSDGVYYVILEIEPMHPLRFLKVD